MDKETKQQDKVNKEKSPEELKANSITRAQVATSSIMAAAITFHKLDSRNLDAPTAVEELYTSAKKINDGNTEELGQMLMTQAKTLDYFFHETLQKLPNCMLIDHIRYYTDMALRAQNQSRKTILALAELKNPRRTMFIKQQNNAVNQQVNNVVNPELTNFENPKKVTNELLSETNHEALDFRGTPETIGINSTMEAMAISRGEDS